MEFDDSRLRAVWYLVEADMPRLPYHNPDHVAGFFSAASRLADLEGVNPQDRLVLFPASLLHDVVFEVGAGDNEERSVGFASTYLPTLGYSKRQVQRVGSLIMSTKEGYVPKNLLEMIMRDSDSDNLGTYDFWAASDKVRIENGLPDGLEWYRKQLAFMKAHEYYTHSQRIAREKGKELNISILEDLINSLSLPE